MFQTFLIAPLYNGFIFLVGITGGDVGLAIIALTLIVRAVFYPAFAASIRTQMGMQAAQADLDEINKKYKDNPEEKARQTLDLYKKKKIRPFAGIIALVVQLPIFIALYFALFREGLPHVAQNLLYSFVSVPQSINTNFLGVINLLSPHNIVLALFVGALQYTVAHISTARTKSSLDAMSKDKQAAQRMQQNMMLYMFPALMGFVSYSLPAAVAIYFIATNIVSIAQELIIKRQLKKNP